VAAEYLMGIVRKGTHDYAKFVRPEELRQWGALAGLRTEDVAELRYIPLIGHARLCGSLSMNYMIHLKR
jgi:2-polyprenyl-6-hydroxyphenyl methylase / 3-demethylubiquinone-9 3-methyltransferase